MRSTKGPCAAAILTLSCLAHGVAAKEADPDPAQELADTASSALAAAAADTWPCQDGCAARTRATMTAPILGPTEVAWTYEAPGTIDGDPRVWKDWVVVASFDGEKGVHHLAVLRLADGKRFGSERTYKNGPGLDAAIWNDLVFTRDETGSGEVLRIVPELGSLTSVRKTGSAFAPLFVDGDLVVGAVGAIWRTLASTDATVWAMGVRGMEGRLAARDGFVYTVARNDVKGYVGKKVTLERVSLATGTRAGTWELGWEPEANAKDEWRPLEPPSVVVGSRYAIAYHPGGVRLKDAEPATASIVDLAATGSSASAPVHALGVPVGWGGRLVFGTTEGADGSSLNDLTAPSGDEHRPAGVLVGWVPLATPGSNGAFAPTATPFVVARGIAIGAGGSFDLSTHRVVEMPEVRRGGVTIPARETMLVVEDGRRLVARRAPHTKRVGGGPRLAPDPAVARTEIRGTSAFTLDGLVRTGTTVVTGKDGRVAIGGAAAAPLDDVGAILDADGRILHGPDAGVVARAIPRIVAQRTKGDWLALAKKASGSHDLASLRLAIDDLESRGGKPEDVAALRREVIHLEHPSALTAVPDRARVDEVKARRAELLSAEAKALWTACAGLPEATPLAYRIDLLRAVLAYDPSFAPVRDWVRDRLPAGIDVAGTPDGPMDWLDVVEAAAQTSLQAVAVDAKDGEPLPPDARALASARATWRKDLLGLRSERLLILTPVARPGRIARCLSLGELVCSTLDREFGVSGSAAAAAEPLVIHLYETKEEYLSASPVAQGGPEGRAWMESTLGYYSPAEGISRLFVPEGRDAFEGVMRVFAHELTHHWLDRRMPPPAGGARSSDRATSPGYFLEEGFATMVEQWAFDLRARTVATLDRKADGLDAVAGAPRLLPWDDLLALPQAAFHALGLEPVVDVPCRWTLGRFRRMSETNLFYSQGAAVCEWLFAADDGKRRPVLLAWIRDYHAGRTAPGDVPKRTGLSPSRLGAAVQAWSIEVSRGD